MSNPFRLILLFFLVQNSIFAQSIPELKRELKRSKKDIDRIRVFNDLSKAYTWELPDSAIYFAEEGLKLSKEIKNDTSTGILLNRLGILHYVIGERETSLNLLSKSIAVLSKTNNQIALGNAYSNQGLVYDFYGQQDSAMFSFRKSAELYGKAGDSLAVADVWNNIGSAYMYRGEFDSSIVFFDLALNYHKHHPENIEYVGDVKANLGSLYYTIGDYYKATKECIRAIRIFDSLDVPNKSSVATFILGTIYERQDLFIDAQKQYKKALELSEKLGLKGEMAKAYLNIGNTFDGLQQTDSAIFYYNKAEEYYSEINDEFGLSYVYVNWGVLLNRQGMHREAISFLKKGADLRRKHNNPGELSRALLPLGQALLKLGNNTDGRRALEEAFLLTELTKDRETELECLFELGKLYRSIGELAKSAEFLERAFVLQDSLKGEQREKMIQNLRISFDTERKELENVKLKEEKDKAQLTSRLNEEKLSAQSARTKLLLFILAGSIILIGVTGFAFLKIKKTNSQILEQKQEVIHQKEIVEEKNKEIVDSINYAKRIQDAYLPPENVLSFLFPSSFLFFQPKDIVSGDFYWFYGDRDDSGKMTGEVFVAVADCTGHGVPGAIMSVICCNALNEVVINRGIKDTGQILDKSRDLIIQMIKSERFSERKDGMDIALCKINTHNFELQFSGANNPLWRLPSGSNEIQEIKGDKQPVGQYDVMKSFSTHLVQLEKGDSLYLFSDGFADQFGGDKGKKFKYSQLKQTLLLSAQYSMSEQKNKLVQEFNSWKGDLEQVDDVCVLGFRL